MVTIPRIKATIALDEETLSCPEQMARRWGVSKSEVLRRVVRAAVREASPAAGNTVSALDELHSLLRLSRAKAQAWARRSRAERRSARARREASEG